MVPPAGVEAVLFDLDGTLLDHDAAAAEAVVASFAGPSGPAPGDGGRVARRWRELEGWAMDRYLAGEVTFAEQRRLRIVRLAGELGLGAWSEREADGWFAGYVARYEAAWRTYADVEPALAALGSGRLRLGVVTNGDGEQQRRKLRKVGLDGVLPHVTVSGEVGAAKPDARIFQAACGGLGLAPGRVAYVGDRLGTDAEAAAAAGLLGVWLDRHDAADDAAVGTAGTAPVPRIGTLTDLAPLLAGHRASGPGVVARRAGSRTYSVRGVEGVCRR